MNNFNISNIFSLDFLIFYFSKYHFILVNNFLLNFKIFSIKFITISNEIIKK